MTKLEITDQAECLAVLHATKTFALAQPTPPETVCDFIGTAGHGAWLVGSNEGGKYKLTFLMDATKSDAMQCFKAIRGPGMTYIAPRITFGDATKPENN
jgi:hypothetical protein